MIVPVEEDVRETLGALIYGADVRSLEEAVLPLLKEKHLTFGTAESCTGGLIAKRLTDPARCIPGVPWRHRQLYCDEVKASVLGCAGDAAEGKGRGVS